MLYNAGAAAQKLAAMKKYSTTVMLKRMWRVAY